MVGAVRQGLGRSEKTSFLIVDAQSVKNTDTAENKGFDGGKLVCGIKRHIGVDTNGLPHMLLITTANVTDRAGALAAFSLYGVPCRKSKPCSWMVAIRESRLPLEFRKYWAQRSKSPNATSFTPLPFFRSDGLSSAHSPGSRSAEDSGKTVSERSIPACKWPSSHSSYSCSEDREQVLSPKHLRELRRRALALREALTV